MLIVAHDSPRRGKRIVDNGEITDACYLFRTFYDACFERQNTRWCIGDYIQNLLQLNKYVLQSTEYILDTNVIRWITLQMPLNVEDRLVKVVFKKISFHFQKLYVRT